MTIPPDRPIQCERHASAGPWVFGGLASITAHALVLASGLLTAAPEPLGDAGVPTRTITISIVTSGAAEADDPAEAVPPLMEEPPDPPEAPAIEPPVPETIPTEATALESGEPDGSVPYPDTITVPKRKPRVPTRPLRPAARAGDPLIAQAEISEGRIAEYEALIWSRIASRKPPGVTAQGFAEVRFALAVDGTLLAVDLATSSGDAGLDALALESVRSSAPFPEPPPGSSARQLVFIVPFSFR
ncbi:hypothetical protein N825_28520 [Skermanella stibiiresistens SB22]|uniref:TonB C-terminal domain-containing protein n=1 Tax=Skermanella stibiiresistens SB22 TaxID=1385369 RepID=W9HCC8_9PROT|nr:TonB family protein [Skermanella stibiiresistens]EWY41538.1 hypothetical protein N825_28520 [Skermanella stibiiresistens SB22]